MISGAVLSGVNLAAPLSVMFHLVSLISRYKRSRPDSDDQSSQ
ncbi:hypothetical protein [Escherichia phage pEC-N1203-2Af.1]|nr:hypothetical protein [Escherichia phage pEC-N1203-2Af.1]